MQHFAAMEEAFESEERRSPYGSADDDEIYSLNLDTGTLRRPSRGKSLLDQVCASAGRARAVPSLPLSPWRRSVTRKAPSGGCKQRPCCPCAKTQCDPSLPPHPDCLSPSLVAQDEIKSIKRRSVRNFYLHQNEQIDEFVSAERVLAGGRSKQEEEEAAELAARQSKGVRVAIYGSFILNVLLFGAKVTAVVLSGSLSAIASAIDSFLDLLSGSIMFVTSFILRKVPPPIVRVRFVHTPPSHVSRAAAQSISTQLEIPVSSPSLSSCLPASCLWRRSKSSFAPSKPSSRWQKRALRWSATPPRPRRRQARPRKRRL